MTFEQAKDQIARDWGLIDFKALERQGRPTENMMKFAERVAQLYADSVARDKDKLIKELWSLWESMAECGELHIGPKFSQEYKQLKTRIPT